jgi:hypothetical protein
MIETYAAQSTISPAPAIDWCKETPVLGMFRDWAGLVQDTCEDGISDEETDRRCALSVAAQDALFSMPIQSHDDLGAFLWVLMHKWGDAGCPNSHPCDLRGGHFNQREGQLAAAALANQHPRIAAIALSAGASA